MEKSVPPKFVVIGGGPCGLYAARTLAEQGINVVLLEKSAQPGGLATSKKCGENFYDLGVHMLHEYDKPLLADIKDIMGDERIEVPLDAKIRWAGAFYRYPLQFIDMVKGIPPLKLIWCVLGLFGSQLWFKIFPRKPKDAEEALIQLYGMPLYKFFFKDFTGRYWGFPTTSMSAQFITAKMPRLTAVDVIKKILYKFGLKPSLETTDSALLDETLHYSRTGAETMTRKLADRVSQLGGQVHLGHEAVRLEMENNRITAVISRDASGAEHRHPCDCCISTMPLPWLVQRLSDGVTPEVIAATEHLKYKPITINGLLVNKPRCLSALYIYYRERIFHRVGEPKNAGLLVKPEDHTVLIVETTCEVGDDRWNAAPNVREEIMKGLEAENICTRDQIKEWHVLNYEHGYPAFRLGFEAHFDLVMKHVQGISNLTSVGRQGAFTYPNMHKAMRMGGDAAVSLLKKYQEGNA